MAGFFNKNIAKMKKRDRGENLQIKRNLKVNQQITVNNLQILNKLGEKHDL